MKGKYSYDKIKRIMNSLSKYLPNDLAICLNHINIKTLELLKNITIINKRSTLLHSRLCYPPHKPS